MKTKIAEYDQILVAVDFSPHSEAALCQAIWLAKRTGARIVAAHVLPDFRKALLSASQSAQYEMFVGEGDRIQREIREDSDKRLRALIAKLNATDLNIRCETLLGDPSIAIIHAVLQEKHDLVMMGTHGLSVWERLFVGSTAKRMIRKCPTPVWTVKGQDASIPKVVLAATDFSDVSRQAVLLARDIARSAGAQFHLLHVVDTNDIPEGAVERLGAGSTLREIINQVATQRLDEFISKLDADPTGIERHLSWGIPAGEIARLADHLKADLLVLGTVGRSGVNGVLLGNTAEKVLDHCQCSILTVKPDGFVCPISPPFWPLHPESPVTNPV